MCAHLCELDNGDWIGSAGEAKHKVPLREHYTAEERGECLGHVLNFDTLRYHIHQQISWAMHVTVNKVDNNI